MVAITHCNSERQCSDESDGHCRDKSPRYHHSSIGAFFGQMYSAVKTGVDEVGVDKPTEEHNDVRGPSGGVFKGSPNSFVALFWA